MLAFSVLIYFIRGKYIYKAFSVFIYFIQENENLLIFIKSKQFLNTTFEAESHLFSNL